MDNANYDPKLVQTVVGSRSLDDDPFVLVDVGCGLGIDDVWRRFGSQLRVHGIDPQVSEIERLRASETSSGVYYHAAFVGLAEDHPIRRRRRERASEDSYFEPFARTSSWAAIQSATEKGDVAFYETNDWPAEELTKERVGLAELLQREGVSSVDFVKTDTDGADLEVLVSFESMIEPARVLGFMVETPFTGSADESVHTFANVDRLLKRHGFLLASMSVNRYSRHALPAPFQHAILAQTTWGQPQWGDLVYLRDAAHPDHVRFGELPPTKLLKLACLYDIFNLADGAADTLLAHRDELASFIDIDAALDVLTPPLNGEQLSYREYVAAFEADPTSFYPRENVAPPEPPPPAPSGRLQRAKRVAARILGRV